MTRDADNRTTELLKDYAFALRRLEYAVDKPGSNMTLGEYEAEEKRVTDEYAQAIAATVGGIDDALVLLDEIREAGRISYGDYSQLFDAIAELGSGTCYVVNETWNDYGGMERDTYDFELSCGHSFEWLELEPPKHCPDCGKEIRR